MSTVDISRVPGWQIEGQSLVRKFEFKDFKEAFSFVTSVALLAEKHGHHPDWSNSYNTVEIRLSTHSANAVTEKDVELATAINAVPAADR